MYNRKNDRIGASMAESRFTSDNFAGDCTDSGISPNNPLALMNELDLCDIHVIKVGGYDV